MKARQTMNRRRFCSLASGMTLASQGLRGAAARTPPNILYCLADDWSFPHAGAYGDRVVKTPTFDRVAKQGVLFTHAFSAAPSCTPSRAAMLTGQAPHRLREGGNLLAFLPKEFAVYPDLLEQAGYSVGYTRKGWGPGELEPAGRTRNPAGDRFDDFAAFLKQAPPGKPFCFLVRQQRSASQLRGRHGGANPGCGRTTSTYRRCGRTLRRCAATYSTTTLRCSVFDREVGGLLDQLQAAGKADNTIVVISGDNGWPFPALQGQPL